MSYVSAFIILCYLGVVTSRQPDIDINRVKFLPEDASRLGYPANFYDRGSLEAVQFRRSNDYDDHSSGLGGPHSPMHIIYDATTSSNSQKTIKVHKPREDPRLFYQSDAYIKDINQKNVNFEVSSIYPGREVVHAGDGNSFKLLPIRSKYREENHIPTEDFNLCVRCPHDRTIIARSGSDRVVLQSPRLSTCSGLKPPRNIHFETIYGPKFGSLIGQGSHMIVGKITHKGDTLQLCKMQVHVVVQGCPTPKYLITHCNARNKPCNFTCRDSKFELHGESTLICGDDMKWNGVLPTCRARTWCESPPPPEHGRISCQGTTAAGNRPGLAEGSRCRVRCARGWRSSLRAAAVCRRGSWTHALSCQAKRKTIIP